MKPTVIFKPIPSTNYKVGRRNNISRVTFHHIVGTAQSAIAKFQTPGIEVSATYIIGLDGVIYQCVKDADTAYCDGNADSNSRTISIEHAGPPYTEAMYQSSIALVSWLVDQYGISDFKRHREVSDKPTICPGKLDVERIIKEAKEEIVYPTADDVTYMFINGFGRPARQDELDTYTTHGWPDLNHAIMESNENLAKVYKKQLDASNGEFTPVSEQLYFKQVKRSKE